MTEVDHVKVGPDAPPLAQANVHLPPVLLHLYEHRSLAVVKAKMAAWQTLFTRATYQPVLVMAMDMVLSMKLACA